MYKVVVVEDEKLVRQGIVRGTDWTRINCMVVGEAEDGEKGLETARKYHPDVIITDICMPRMSGIEMVEALREEENDAVVIFLTAYEDFSYAQKAVRLDAADYLLKPFEDGDLEDAVERILEKNRKKAQEEEKNPECTLKKGDKSKYIMDAIAYIEENYADPNISVRSAAERLSISEGHLSHLFRKETDFTFLSYLMQCRMRAAKNLLKDHRRKVYEVAEMVGYKDITYFSVTFKKQVGVSPSEYQDRYRE
jgi:two-component system, response regulator YesN